MKDKSIILEEAKKEQQSGNYQKALDLLKQIFDIDDYFVSFEYAKTLYSLKKYEEAIDVFLTLNEKNKEDKNIIDFIIKCYRESDNTTELIKFVETNDVIDSNVLLEIAETFFIDRKYNTAINFYEQYVEKNKEDINIVSKLLQIYNFLGYKQKAIDLSNKYLTNTQVCNDKFLYNLFLNEQEIAQDKIILKSNPRIMLVMITNKCNLRCPMCATIHQKNQWEISNEFKQYILNNLGNLELITWQGGEVFLYEGFKDLFLKATENKYLKQIIITNGLLINEEWANLITKANNLDLTLSIDSIEKDIYEKLRVGANFERLLKNLECIKEYRIKNNSNITVTMRTTISDENVYTLDKMVDFAIRYNINILIWSPLIMDANKQYSLKNKSDGELLAVKKNIDEAFDKAQKNKIKIIYLLEKAEDILNRRNNKVKEEKHMEHKCGTEKKCNNITFGLEKKTLCFRPWKQLATTVEGKLRPECMCLENIGDIHDCKNFEQLWNNDTMQEYRKKLVVFNQQWCCDNCKNNIVSEEHKKFTCW